MNKLSPMRQRILDYVTAFTRENGYPPTVREICEAVGLRSPSTVHSHLKILQEGGYLEKDDRKTRALSVKGGSGTAFRSVPILGTVTAGLPILAQEDTLGYVPYDGPEQGEMFALQVRGESMLHAGILDGDIVLVRRQNTAMSGQIVVALIGSSNPLGVVIAGIFYGALKYAGSKLNLIGAPSEVIKIITGTVVFFIAISHIFKIVKKRKAGKK